MPDVPWLSGDRDRWFAAVSDWLLEKSHGVGLGDVLSVRSVHERPWAAVLRVDGSERTAFFKAVGPHGWHEPPILRDLATRWPALGPDVLALDTSRGWIVMADHGRPMRDVLDPLEQTAIIERILPVYAQMQASTTALVGPWLDAGTPDRRVERLPELLERMLAGDAWGGPLAIDDDERGSYEATLGDLTRACAELAATPMAVGIDHADMHGTNVLVDGGRHRLVDWGDSCITHPFCSLFVPYEFVVSALDAGDRRRARLRLRDVYLEVWGSSSELREAFGLAVWVAGVARALNVDHGNRGAAADDLANGRTEIVTLLRAWHAKRHAFRRGADLLD